MGVEDESPSCLSAREPSEDIGPAGCHVLETALDTGITQHPGDESGNLSFSAAPSDQGRIHRLDLDQEAQEVNGALRVDADVH